MMMLAIKDAVDDGDGDDDDDDDDADADEKWMVVDE